MMAKRLSAKSMAAAVILALGTGLLPFTARTALAATSTSVSPLQDANFEQGPNAVWWERQGSGVELIDGWDPHAGTYSADLCAIDSCTDGKGNGGDVVAQTFTAPGQVTSATLTYWYNVATSEPDANKACHDWLRVGVGTSGVPDNAASKQYCAATSPNYIQDSIDLTAYLQAHGGENLQVIAAGFTDGLNPSEFLVDDITLNITYLTTPSAPLNITSIKNCSTGTAQLSWSAPKFPLGNTWPVQSYTITPYNIYGVAQPAIAAGGSQTSATVDLHGGTVCYFTVQATNANGPGAAGAPSSPSLALTSLPATENSTGYTLSWHAQPYSATAKNYTVFVRDGNGSWLQWGATTAQQSLQVFGFRGHTYGYYVEAFTASGDSSGSPWGAMTTTSVAANAALSMPFTSLYGVDAYGFLHHYSSPVLAPSSTWPNWKIVRGLAVDGDGQGGQVLDAYGGLHPFGNAPGLSCGSAYWPGWEIARGVVVRPDGKGAYILDGFGGVHNCGDAPPVKSISGYWPGWDIARGLVLRPDGISGYTLDAYGGIHPFGGAPAISSAPYWGWDIARAFVLRPDGVSGYVLDGYGGVHPFGGAPAVSVSAYWPGWDVARSLTIDPDGAGGYVLDGYGSVHPYGNPIPPGAALADYPGADVMKGADSA